jgi:hypothetical protein
MKKMFIKRVLITLTYLFLISSTVFAQFDNIDFLRGGVEDGVKLTKAYLAPWLNAFGAGLNGSWYNTARPHKLGGFDITTSVNVGFVPSADKTFNLPELNLTRLTGSGSAPTVAGPDNDGPTLTYSQAGVTVASFKTPPGTGWSMIPVPMAQVGIGLPLGTELKARFVPKINISDGDIALWGIGLMHSLMQYFPGDKVLPFDISLFGGYTRLTGNVPLELMPGEGAPSNYVTYNPSVDFKNQVMNVTMEGWNLSAIGSVNLPVISFYGGLGYSKSATDIKLTGNFPLPVVNTDISTTQGVYEDKGVVTNFPDIAVENFSGLRANIGFRLKLSVVTIHADYTRASYNVASAGLGISFR